MYHNNINTKNSPETIVNNNGKAQKTIKSIMACQVNVQPAQILHFILSGNLYCIVVCKALM